MLARQRALAPAPEPPAEPAPPPATLATLRLRIDPERKPGAARRLRQAPAVDPALARALDLRPEETTFDGLALFVLCRTPDHVPDHWRTTSPLGRDFTFTPRHRMLGFEPGPPRDPDARRARELVLDLPEELRAEVTPDTAHDLSVGIAVRIGQRWATVALANRDGVRLAAGEESTLDVEILGGNRRDPRTIRVRFPGR